MACPGLREHLAGVNIVNMTRGQRRNLAGLAALLLTVAGLGCARPGTPLDLTSLDSSQDQQKIATYHRREAVLFRLKAEEAAERLVVYERLFGPESEWVAGVRLLVQFYEDAAKEQERQADWHLGIARNGHSQSMTIRPTSP
jgi:hypothetical protein